MQPHAGYALYPQDMDGTRQRSSEEHGRILLHKAQLAAEVARTRGPGGFQAGRAAGYTAGCFGKAGTSGGDAPFAGPDLARPERGRAGRPDNSRSGR